MIDQPNTFKDQLETEQLSHNTIVAYIRLLKYYELNYKDITEETIKHFIKIKNHTVARAFIKKYIIHNKKAELIPYIPKVSGRKSREIKYLEPPEIQLIIEKTENINLKAIILLMYESGLRVSEACKIKKKDIDFYKNTLTIIGKGNKEATVMISENTKKILEHITLYKPAEEKVFDGWYREKVWRNIKGLGFKYLKKSLHPHMFRHSLATELLTKNVDLQIIRKIMRHDSIDSTVVYAHVKDKQVSEAWNKIIKENI